MDEDPRRVPEREREAALRGMEVDSWLTKAARVVWLAGTLAAIGAVFIFVDRPRAAIACALLIASFSWLIYKTK